MSSTSSVRPIGKSMTRVTKGGPGQPSRKLTYLITVIQQPERARACGSGAKSSADRRPVDPPPVVELRIMEGENADKDITFQYAANFFLFATLESVRPMAHGRVHPAPPQIPVLTGMPVSGMAYLDRPNEAGYFIFPDLSVRHEGRYVLSFNLYEETKEEYDFDAEPAVDSKPKMPGPNTPNASFDWRMEVASDPFTVFSAKKFPGLAESTSLSRTVAEQGCRVRIRRDVRMRRRDKGGDYDDGPGEQQQDAYARPGRMDPIQDAYQRERSRSTASDDGRRPYPEHYNSYHSQNPTPSPPPGQNPLPPGERLSFGAVPGSGQGGNAPFAQPFAQPPAPPAAHQPHQYQQGHPYPPGGQPPQPYSSQPPPQPQFRGPPPPPPAPQGYPQERQYPQSAYSANPPREHQMYDDPHRRASVSFPPPAPIHTGFHPTTESRPLHRPPFSAPNRVPSPMTPHNVLPPLKVPELSQKFEGQKSPLMPLSAVRTTAPPFPSPGYERPYEPRPYQAPLHPAYSQPPIHQTPFAQEPPKSGNKRTHDIVFNSTSHHPLRNGNRPESLTHETEEAEDDEFAAPLTYKRAGGYYESKPVPAQTLR